MEKKQMILYNVLFPIWILVLFPQTWVVVLPANLLIDFMVVWASLRLQKVEGRGPALKSSVLKVWVSGFAADLLGTLPMLLMIVLAGIPGTASDWYQAHVCFPVMENPFTSGWALAWVLGCILLAAWAIYQLNLRWSFAKTALTDTQKKKAALALAVCTAPYLFLLPSSWLYGF